MKNTILLLLVLMLASCKENVKNEATESVDWDTESVEAEPESMEATADTSGIETGSDQPPISFCCHNHSPSHCGESTAELRKLSNQKNCVFQ